MELSTIPKRIYKESDQIWPVEEGEQLDTCDTESWSFYIVGKITRFLLLKPYHGLSLILNNDVHARKY